MNYKKYSKIVIETNENDYMTYFTEAGAVLEGLMKEWNMEWTEKKIKDSFISLTESFYFIIRNEKISEQQVKALYNDLEVYFDQDAEDYFNPYQGNASEITIIL